MALRLIPSGLSSFARYSGLGNLYQSSRCDVVDIPVDGNGAGNQRMVSNALDVRDHAFRLLLDRQPIYELTLCGPRPGAGIAPDLSVESGGLQAACEQITHDFVAEQLHAAVRVMNNEPLARAQQLIRDDQRPYRVIAGPAARVPDDMGVSFREPCISGRLQSRVHAGENRKLAGRRQGQLALVTKASGITGIRRQDLFKYLAHGVSAFGKSL